MSFADYTISTEWTTTFANAFGTPPTIEMPSMTCTTQTSSITSSSTSNSMHNSSKDSQAKSQLLNVHTTSQSTPAVTFATTSFPGTIHTPESSVTFISGQSSTTSEVTEVTSTTSSSRTEAPTLIGPSRVATSKNQTLAIIGGAVSGFLVLFVSGLLFFLWYRRKRRLDAERLSHPFREEESRAVHLSPEKSPIPYIATPNNISPSPQMPRAYQSTQNLLQARNSAGRDSHENIIEEPRDSRAVELERQNESLRWELEELQAMLGTPSPPYYASGASDGQGNVMRHF